jgi:hypothetical protein
MRVASRRDFTIALFWGCITTLQPIFLFCNLGRLKCKKDKVRIYKVKIATFLYARTECDKADEDERLST